MPGLNGFETLALLRQMEDMQDVPVIYLTGLKQTENEVKGINTGAADYIIKPFVRESLLARLRQHLEKGKRLRQLSILEKNKTADGIDMQKYEQTAEGLTETERKILWLIAKGYSNQEICDELHYTSKKSRQHDLREESGRKPCRNEKAA